MEDTDVVEESAARQARVADRLREAREALGRDVAQVAAETRIPQRHLVSLEAGDYAALPSRTYAIGFARTYARSVGLDEREIVDQVRVELSEDRDADGAPARFEPGDPARVPGRGLAWFAVFAGILLIAGIYAFYSSYFAPGLGPAPLTEATAAPKPKAAAKPASPAQPVANGPVVFTALMDETWVKFYDAKGERLFEGVMKKGDAFTVPANAENPQIRTGRPYAFAITVGGRAVPKLSEEDIVIKDVPVSGAALLARPPMPVAAAPGAAPQAAPTIGTAPQG